MDRGKHDEVMDESVKRSHHGSPHPEELKCHEKYLKFCTDWRLEALRIAISSKCT